jgi:hypothetical protein
MVAPDSSCPRLAHFADRILQGARLPGPPIEQWSSSKPKALGAAIPSALLVSADELIE